MPATLCMRLCTVPNGFEAQVCVRARVLAYARGAYIYTYRVGSHVVFMHVYIRTNIRAGMCVYVCICMCIYICV